MTGPVKAEKLLADLEKVWANLGKEQDTSGGVLRAAAMTLVALVQDNAHPIDISDTVSEIMQDHPSRAVVIRIAPDRPEPLDASASAFCWKPFGRRQQICCEQIEIRATPESLGDVPAVLRGLMVPDLPVVLWARSPGLLDSPAIDAFLDLSDKVIIESRGFADWRGLMAKVVAWNRAGRVVADLAWVRITRWREIIAQLFEKDDLRNIFSIRNIRIVHSSPEPGPAATYLAAWLRLTTQSGAAVHFEQAGETTTWQIQEVNLSGDGLDVSIRRTDHGVVHIETNHLSTCAVFRQLKEADLLREELSIAGEDTIFKKVLATL